MAAESGAGDAGPREWAERLVRLGERRFTWPELCAKAGVEHAIADRLWRALGFPDVDPDDPVYTDDDVRALKIATEGLDALRGEERSEAVEFIVREARSVSANLARIADIQVDSFAELARRGLRETALRQAVERGVEDSDLGWLLTYGLRRRLDDSIRRRAGEAPGDQPVLAIGFVDLVDFTYTSARLEADEFGSLLNRFESLAWDVVTEAGGQVVKLIGDEAMFVCPTPGEAARAALDVLDACARAALPRARGGLASGPLLHRDGDYFGPAVNLASRLTDQADPDTVLVDEDFRSQLDSAADFALERLGPRPLRGIGEVTVWRLAAA
jgi:adenylate cyclase